MTNGSRNARTHTGKRLHIAESFSACDHLLADWFDEVVPIAWQQPLPTLVIAPTRGYAQALKARLLARGASHLGLQFVTPAVLRGLLDGDETAPAPAPADLRLLLAIAAEQRLSSRADAADEDLDADHLAAKAVVRTPDHLLRTLERLEAAGWKFDKLGLSSFQPIVREFRALLRTCELHLVASADRRRAAEGATGKPLFADVLITGFDGAHWPHWFLLRAAVAAAERATVVLEYPRDHTSTIDACWIGSWEEALGEATPLSPSDRSTDTLFSDAEMRGTARAARQTTFLVGADTREQARAIALLCLRFLAEDSCSRVGIVFAGAGALPRLVAAALSAHDIPHHDAIGFQVPGVFETPDWATWLQLQRGPRVNSLLRFLSTLAGRVELVGNVSPQRFERTLRAAFAEVLIDDLQILRQFCAGTRSETDQEVATALGSIWFLPARGTLRDYLAATEQAFTQLGWQHRWTEIANRFGTWPSRLAPEFSRTLYLRWLDEIASTSGASRSAAGDHPYARVQLLPVAHAVGQEWSHLIFAGLNEGSWPPPDRGEFAREEEIQAFNREIQQLNRRATRQGHHGEGHTSVRDGHALYLGPMEQRQIALRQFHTLLESTTERLTVAASLVQESAPERLWNPSELFTQLYQQAHRQPLTQAAMRALQTQTAQWLARSNAFAEPSPLLSISVEQTRVAYDARRDPEQAAGVYEFALGTPISTPPVLSVSEVEALLKSPALVWMKKFLGVEGPDDDSNPWAASTGQWVHRWLASIGGANADERFVPLPDAAEIDRRICAAADAKCAEVERLCKAAGKRVPDWWSSGWQNALCLARHLGTKLAKVEGWRWIAAEWTVNADQPVQIADGVSLAVRGRIDVVLSRDEEMPRSLSADELWILDYKTGAKRALVAGKEDAEKRKPQLRKKLITGTAIQLALYALAARQLGARDVLLSLVSPMVTPVTPQLSATDIGSETDIFEELARMQQTGVFGMLGRLRNAFAFTRDYPLATLGIDQDVLAEKWERTHPVLALDEEENFWW